SRRSASGLSSPACRKCARACAKAGTSRAAEQAPRRPPSRAAKPLGYPIDSPTTARPAHPAVSDPHPARPSDSREDKRTFFQKIAEFIHPGPDSKAELIETLADAEDNEIIGAESRAMLEGVIRMAELTAGDVMVPAPRMDLINIDSPMDELL